MKTISIVCAIVWSSTIFCAHAQPNSRPDDCTLGARAARAGSFDKALLEWRLMATDNSQKSWVRAACDCLKIAGIARTDEAVFNWFVRAVDARSRYALVPLALLYINGDGVEVDLDRARKLLSDASRKGDEAAEVLLLKLAEHAQSKELPVSK